MMPSSELHLDIQLRRHGARLEVETPPHEGAPTVYRLIEPHSGVSIAEGLTFTQVCAWLDQAERERLTKTMTDR